MEPKKKSNTTVILIIGVLVAIGLIWGGFKFVKSLSHETTDDAQIQANMNPIIPHINGYVEKVFVTDNQTVKKGDTLFTIDQRDYLVKIEQAKANLSAAESQVVVAQASIGSYKANVGVSTAQVNSAVGNTETAKIRLGRATKDFERYKNLYESHSITAQQFEQAEAAKQEAQQQVQILKSQQNAVSSQKTAAISQTDISQKQVSVAEANVKTAEAMLDAANLNLEYSVVTASIDGQLSSISIQPGQLVSQGQSLFYIVDTQSKWVVANFKETQLEKIQIGQKVTLEVDAYPGVEFEGEVSAFSPATGARFSLLPPDNATGNFVKTVQRLPIKIDFVTSTDAEKLSKLRSGMNVEVDIHLN
jgi:membrane fusion protein (multidrug efflux system)